MHRIHKVKELVKLVVYRCAEKGMEILIIPEETENGKQYKLPFTEELDIPFLKNLEESITLRYGGKDEDGENSAVAFEQDHPDLPSLRKLLKEDVQYAAKRLKDFVPQPQGLKFVNLKDAFKNMLPNEYDLLKEIKEIISDRNVLKNI